MSERQYLVRFGPNANCTLQICPIEESVYRYRPSLPANIFFTIIFVIALIFHIVLSIRWRTWWVMLSMILSCVHEIVGYIARIFLWRNPWNFAAFMVQIICITQAPVFYCAAIYVLLGQSIDYYAPKLARFSTRIFIWVFLPCDITSLILQGIGGSLSASSSGSSTVGVDLAMAGLIFQVITLFGFSSFFVDFLIRFFRSQYAAGVTTRDRLFFGFLGLAVLTTFARCTFRAVELRQGYKGELISHEELFIGLEGVLIVVAIFSLGIGHAGFAFKKRDAELNLKEESSSDGEDAPRSVEPTLAGDKSAQPEP